MEELSREQINRALDELRAVRRESGYRGRLSMQFAMCYSMSFSTTTTIYDWEKLSHRHMCRTCRKTFGAEGEPTITVDKYDKSLGGYPATWVDSDDYERFYKMFLRLLNIGSDVILEINCADCIAKKHACPMLLKFRIAPDVSYTVSYPKIDSNMNEAFKCAGDNVRGFRLYEYETAISFIEEVWKYAGGGPLKDACRKWLEEFRSGMTYEGLPWSVIFDALNGILGSALGE